MLFNVSLPVWDIPLQNHDICKTTAALLTPPSNPNKMKKGLCFVQVRWIAGGLASWIFGPNLDKE